MTYSEESVNNMKILLNNMEVKGIENCKRVVLIAQLLETPEKENKDGES